MNNLQKYLSTCLLATAALVGGASPAFAADAPSLGAASDFAVLSALTTSPGAVTCTNSAVNGKVGTASSNPLSVTQTLCTINGDIITPVSAEVLTGFNGAYDALASITTTPCGSSSPLTTLPSTPLSPGVYCFNAAVTVTDGTLTLAGSSNDIWIFKIGTLGTGALTGTDFSVVMEGGEACNVYWWVAEAATMTRADFKGTILAGAAVTITGGTFTGDALAKAAVTMTGVYVNGCEGSSTFIPPRLRCNQGVGNGTEGCDPGNSNQGFPFRSNDELGGVPGDPGRLGN